MSFQKRALHFWGAIWRSLVSLLVGGLLSVAIVFVPHAISLAGYDDQVAALLVGVIASIFSALVLRVGDKYNESLAAAETIGSQVELFISYVEKSTDKGDALAFQLWPRSMSICDSANKLTYKKDFGLVSKNLSNLCEAVTQGENPDMIGTYLGMLQDSKRIMIGE